MTRPLLQLMKIQQLLQMINKHFVCLQNVLIKCHAYEILITKKSSLTLSRDMLNIKYLEVKLNYIQSDIQCYGVENIHDAHSKITLDKCYFIIPNSLDNKP